MAWPIHAYLEERSLELSPRTVAGYRWILRSAQSRISKPLSELSSRDILGLAVTWGRRDQNLSCLREFLRWAKHPLAEHVPRGIPPGTKRALIWYTIAELEAIVAACATPRERLIVHLACELMFRRIEIARATWDWFRETHVWILGKGRHGGKPRTIPYHPYTRALLAAYAASAKTRRPAPTSATPRPSSSPGRSATRSTGSSRVEGRSGGASARPQRSLLSLRRSALDKELKKIEESLRWEGVNLSLEFHALRRTGGRLFVQAGTQMGKGALEVLNELRGIYGHEDLRTTMRYIGWEIETAGATMAHMPRLETRSQAAVVPTAEGNGPGGMTAHSRRKTPPTS